MKLSIIDLLCCFEDFWVNRTNGRRNSAHKL